MLMKSLKLKASADDLNLAVLVSEPECAPKGVFQIVHGMCEHKERYAAFMEYLSGHGYVCVIHDHRGHGESVKTPDDLGFMYKGGWRAMVEDVKLVADWAKAHYPGLKHVLLGHSMGSMVVRSFTKRHDDMIDTAGRNCSRNFLSALSMRRSPRRGIRWHGCARMRRR